MIWIPLLLVVVVVSVQDIWTRQVTPLVIAPLLGVVMGGWLGGAWEVSWIGGALALIGTAAIKLPAGDVIGFSLVGLLVGPLVAMLALSVSCLWLLGTLLLLGHRWSLVRHPFFPYLGAATLTIYTLADFH